MSERLYREREREREMIAQGTMKTTSYSIIQAQLIINIIIALQYIMTHTFESRTKHRDYQYHS